MVRLCADENCQSISMIFISSHDVEDSFGRYEMQSVLSVLLKAGFSGWHLTRIIGGQASTKEMTEAIIEKIMKINEESRLPLDLEFAFSWFYGIDKSKARKAGAPRENLTHLALWWFLVPGWRESFH